MTGLPASRRCLRSVRSDRSGLSLTETVIAVAMVGLLTLAIYQMQVLGVRQSRANIGNTETHQSIRQTLEWLVEDLLVARQASVIGNDQLIIDATLKENAVDVDRRVEYYLDGDKNQLIRKLKDPATGEVLQEHGLARFVQEFVVTHDPNTDMVTYQVRVEAKNAKYVEIAGQVHLRNAGSTL